MSRLLGSLCIVLLLVGCAQSASFRGPPSVAKTITEDDLDGCTTDSTGSINCDEDISNVGNGKSIQIGFVEEAAAASTLSKPPSYGDCVTLKARKQLTDADDIKICEEFARNANSAAGAPLTSTKDVHVNVGEGKHGDLNVESKGDVHINIGFVEEAAATEEAKTITEDDLDGCTTDSTGSINCDEDISNVGNGKSIQIGFVEEAAAATEDPIKYYLRIPRLAVADKKSLCDSLISRDLIRRAMADGCLTQVTFDEFLANRGDRYAYLHASGKVTFDKAR